MIFPLSRLLVIFVSLSILVYIKCLQLDVHPGDYRCIGQELDEEDTSATIIIGVTASTDIKKSQVSQKFSFEVLDPNDESVLNERVVIGNRPKEYSFEISDRGTYLICFNVVGGSTPLRVKFHVDFKDTIEAELKSKNKVVKDDLPSLELQLKAAEEALEDISREIDFARKEELSLREARDATAKRIHRFGYLSISILVTASVWQIIYLRRFFTSKKLL